MNTAPRSDIQEITRRLAEILQARGQDHGGYDGYVQAMQIFLNMTLGKKLKRPLSKREVSMVMVCHKLARLMNADEAADVGDTLMDMGGYALLAVLQEQKNKEAAS